jgi:adenosylmethionine-8-amino-7-oxononanoate aminotransferase
MIEASHRQFQAAWGNHPKLKRCDVLGTILVIEYNSGESSYNHPLKGQLSSFFLQQRIVVRPLGNVLYLLPPYCITEEELQFIYSQIIVTLKEWP